MRLLTLLLLVPCALAGPLASRQQASSALLEALRGAQLNVLADTLANNTALVDAVLASPGTKTILAPNDKAMRAVPEWTTSNPQLLQATLLMHVLNGSYNLNDLASPPPHTVGHSFLTLPTYANLPGGNGLAVALSRDNEDEFVQEAANTNAFSSADPIVAGNLTIQPIARALTVPGNATATLDFLGQHSALLQALRGAGVADMLDEMRGVTLFVPNDQALASYAQQHNFTADAVGGKALLLQHVIASRSVYSPLLDGQGSMINAAGQDVVFDKDAQSVRVGDSTARITQYDIMHKGGVIHYIDAVLASTKYDESRAAAAAASAAKSANSYVAGPISGVNAASSQGPDLPGPNADNPESNGFKSSTMQTHDASNGSGAAPGAPGSPGSAISDSGNGSSGNGTSTGSNGSGSNGNGTSGSGTNGSNGSNGSSSGNGRNSASARSQGAASLLALAAAAAAAVCMF